MKQVAYESQAFDSRESVISRNHFKWTKSPFVFDIGLKKDLTSTEILRNLPDFRRIHGPTGLRQQNLPL